MESTIQFQSALADFCPYYGILKQPGARWLLSLTPLIDPGNFRLMVQATDAQTCLYECRLSAGDLETHQRNLGLEKVDWSMYFLLLRTALTERRTSLRLERGELRLEVEYPLSQARLRGTICVGRGQGDAKDVMAFMMTCLERVLAPAEVLKRDRPQSVESREAQKVAIPVAKPQVKRFKRAKELGSKIA